MELLKKDWEHVKRISEENIRGALLSLKMGEINLKMAEEEIAKFPEEVHENVAVK